MESSVKCKTCKFSETFTVVDPVLSSGIFSEEVQARFKLTPQTVVTKCHIKGKPEEVHAERDWCYSWEVKQDV